MNVSLAASFALLSPADRAAALDELSGDELAALEYDWRFWARPNQLPPEGDWQTWLLLAGRGFGKTRTGAEWVRSITPTCGRIALVAATAADVRDVIVEGQSGILAISPPWDRPSYEPSKRRLTWPNGSQAALYSADEPERLRGPEHEAAWCDELCLAGGSLIATPFGPVPIERLRAGDLVHTRSGQRRVARAWCTSLSASVFELKTSAGIGLVGTAGHPIWVVNEGFKPLASLVHGDTLYPWDIGSSTVLCGVGAVGGSTAGTTAIARAGSFTGLSTPPHTDPFHKGTTSTIVTRTRLTSHLKTLWRSVVQIISKRTAREGGTPCRQSVECGLPVKSGHPRSPTPRTAPTVAPGSPQPALAHAFAPAHAEPLIAVAILASAIRSPVSDAASPSWCTGPICNSVPFPALPDVVSRVRAPSACPPFTLPIPEPSVVLARVAMSCAPVVLDVQPLRERRAVYNIEVEGEHEYFANGLLTHNCAWRYPEAWDMLMFGLRLGDDPRAVVTTTPKPVKLVRDLLRDPTTVVTRGSTYDNQANLAEKFFLRTVRKYEGTRLGRQELNAEMLEDVPGALWQRESIDAARVKAAPENLRRVVVAVDPATTSGEDSDETGIVVAGLGVDGMGYVLADVTCRKSPQGWAEEAVKAYRDFKADRIVAETNQGGEMVENTIRTIAPLISYTRVHTKRGKVLRAEPVSALYEQHRVKHVGSLAALEDQMCGFTADFDANKAGYSPDRVDALVYALTELMLGDAKTTAAERFRAMT